MMADNYLPVSFDPSGGCCGCCKKDQTCCAGTVLTDRRACWRRVEPSDSSSAPPAWPLKASNLREEWDLMRTPLLPVALVTAITLLSYGIAYQAA